MKRALVAVLGLFLAGFCLTGFGAQIAMAEEEAEAATTEVVSPVDLEIDSLLNFGQLTQKGVSYTSGFKIKNNGDKEAKIELSFAESDIEGLSEGSKKCADWLAIVGGAVKQVVAAGEEKTIRVRVTIPSDAEVGSQYARIKVLAGEEEKYVNVRLDVYGDDFKVAGELKSSSVAPFSFGDKVKATAEVANIGKSGFSVRNFVQVKSGLSGAADWTTIVDEEKEAVPGATLKLDSESADAIGFGLFTVEQKITFVNAEGEMIEAVRSQVVINCPWWVLAVIGGIIVLIIVAVIIIKRTKAKKETAEAE